MRRFAVTGILAVGLFCKTARADSAAGVQWIAPDPGWHNLGSRPMRAATYVVAALGGDKSDAECGVFYFGPDQGGSIEANLDRWIHQFQQPDGRPPIEVARVSHRRVHGLALTLVEISGSYTGMGGPMAASRTSAPGYKLLGAIVEAPGGLVFFKFVGPSKTVEANRGKFNAMLDSLRGETK